MYIRHQALLVAHVTVKMFQALHAKSKVFFCAVVKLLLSIYHAGSS